MKYIYKNLKNFILNERIIFTVTLICIIASAFIINFAYGLYYNYSIKKIESDIDMKEFNGLLAPGISITKGEIRQYSESLESNTLDAMEVMYLESKDFEGFPGLGDICLDMRYVIHDGKYQICNIVKENLENQNRMLDGRYITNEEEATGAYCALVEGISKDEWNMTAEYLKNSDGTVTLFGQKYTVVGVYNGGCAVPIVPFLTVPEDLEVVDFNILFSDNITRSQYNDLKEKAELILPGKIILPELEFPDNDTITVYNNMMSVAMVLSVISVGNFTMLFYFILQKRQRRLAVMRICGCTKLRAAVMYLCECVLIVLPCYVGGAALNFLLTEKVFSDIFEHFAEAYYPQLYMKLFAVYIAALLVVSAVMVAAAVNKSVVESFKGAEK